MNLSFHRSVVALSLLALTTQTAPTSAQSPEDPATESPPTGPVVGANAPTAEPEVEAATPVEEDTAEASPPTAETSEAPAETVEIDAMALPDVPPAELVPECAPGMRGCFLDIRDTWRSFDHEYARLLHVPEVHYGIAAAEELAFVGIGAIWYFAALEDNKLDWDIESLRQRFSRESVRYDSNTFPMNFVLHPLSGSAYYGFPRTNGLNVLESFALGTAASLTWEFLLEFNERLSINDLLTTPVGGMAIGEFFYRFGRYLNSAPGGGSAWHKAFGYTLGGHVAFHDLVVYTRHGTPLGTVPDSLGYDAAIAHRFIVDAGFGVARTDEDPRFFRYEVRVLADLIAIPGYLRPGATSLFFTDANITRFHLRGSGGPRGNGVELHADAVLLGYFAQNITQAGRGLRGFGLAIGSSVAYTYRRDDHADFHDALGITHLPGVALDAHAFLGVAALHLRGRMNGDFAGVHSIAFRHFRAVNGERARTRSVLDNFGYYYGWGYSARVEAELELPYVTFGASACYGRYATHRGLDRAQEEVEALGQDVPGNDRVIDAEAYVRVHPMRHGPLHVELSFARRRRHSRLEAFRETDTYERMLVRLGATF